MDSYYKIKTYKANLDFINSINNQQSSWTAKSYDFMEGKTLEDMIRMVGGRKSKILG